MADSKQIDDLIQKYQQESGYKDVSWLRWYMHNLKGGQLDAAYNQLNQQIQNYDFGSTPNDVNGTLLRVVRDQANNEHIANDPAARLNKAMPGVGLGKQEKELRAYFENDPYLKDHKDAQNAIVDEMLRTEVGAEDLIKQAKEINFNQRSPEERAIFYGKKAESLSFLTDQNQADKYDISLPNDYDPAAGGGKLNISQLEKYVNELPTEATKAATVAAIRKWAQDNSHWSPLRHNDLGKMLQAAHQTAADSLGRQYNLEKDPAKRDQLLKQAQSELMPGQQLTDSGLRPKAAAAAAGKDPNAPVGTLTDPNDPFAVPTTADTKWHPQNADLYKRITGQDFEKAYQAFIGQYRIAAQQFNQATGLVHGNEAIWTQGGYSRLDQGWVNEPVSKDDPSVKNKKGNTIPSRAQFMQMQSTGTLKLAYQIEAYAATQWNEQYKGIPFPDALRQQISDYVVQMSQKDPSWVYQMLGATGVASQGAQPWQALINGGKSSTTGQWGGSGALDEIISTYVTNNGIGQEAGKQAAVNAWVKQYTDTIGHPPSADEIKRATGADATTQQTIIDNVKMPNGLTYGTYSSAANRLNPKWQQYFGKDATPDQLAWSVGRTEADIQDYIYNSSSRVRGLNIGQYEGYQKFLDDVSGGLWGTGSNDAMIQSLHRNVSGK